MAKKKEKRAPSMTKCPKCGEQVSAESGRCDCGHEFTKQAAANRKLAGLKQNLLTEKNTLEEKMQQLQRRLAAIQVLLED